MKKGEMPLALQQVPRLTAAGHGEHVFAKADQAQRQEASVVVCLVYIHEYTVYQEECAHEDKHVF